MRLTYIGPAERPGSYSWRLDGRTVETSRWGEQTIAVEDPANSRGHLVCLSWPALLPEACCCADGSENPTCYAMAVAAAHLQLECRHRIAVRTGLPLLALAEREFRRRCWSCARRMAERALRWFDQGPADPATAALKERCFAILRRTLPPARSLGDRLMAGSGRPAPRFSDPWLCCGCGPDPVEDARAEHQVAR